MHLIYLSDSDSYSVASPDFCEAGAPCNEIEITPEMVEAGERFIYEEWGGRSPRHENLVPDFVTGLFRAMAASRYDKCTHGDHISDV